MSSNEIEILVGMKKQILAVVVAAVLGGLLMAYTFMTTINSSVGDCLKRIERIENILLTSKTK